MSMTERCQLALAEIARRRAVIAAATTGPWRIADDAGVEQADDFRIICRGTRAPDEAFIAASRNERDAELAAFATAIEGLREIAETRVDTKEGSALDECAECVQCAEYTCVVAKDALTALCDQLGIAP